ncbi:undecaprenyl-phosphate glucose phosphotransferase [Bizionia gelidisalsuginis]|uniref:Undecaprenyl-phosphate glucose phosphotransferase n=2 Tax=Bizionia TaxID=283785 RepID=A0A8H2LD54_9FLAO|nr:MULTISPECIES: undecaprenyl-phosphate glucose phosphotransferase [Bizionia]TYB74201.1 undecaprenyl-phosphate glucose phosphotransferase [Bizionia saleffrena]TYC15663.1 undecaprenyl-phosphate glucose phosphotransferase [Bizionia gelidisalsuginis]
MKYRQHRFSGLIKPLACSIDIAIIIGTIFLFPLSITNLYIFILYSVFFWLLIALKTGFYNIQRHTRLFRLTRLVCIQMGFYAVILYAFIGFFKQPEISRSYLALYFLTCFGLVFAFKITTYLLLLKYRAIFKGNIRYVVVIGKNSKMNQLLKIFKEQSDFGYEVSKQFNTRSEAFSLESCFSYILEHKIDKIYFSVSELTNNQINKLINFADNNLRELKFIPDNKEVFSKKLKYEYYDFIPVLSLREIPLDEPLNLIIKRVFDIIFSTLVIVFLLSWLTPIIAILIKLESKGPVFFKQSRSGFSHSHFGCYKFRSMTVNKNANVEQAIKNDVRITKVGKFIRKTSIDELPQFFNVFLGHMSVAGPRPHMISHTNMYSKKVDKFMVRHLVKPGITGLAQVSGFRGEIETDKDIINRVRFDIFYVENWSLLMDIKIILQTAINAIRGEEKAY